MHLRQFAKAGGPPRTYAEMVRFEAEAYEATLAFLDSKQATQFVKNPAILANAREQSTIYAKAFRDELALVTGRKDSEAQLRDFLGLPGTSC